MPLHVTSTEIIELRLWDPQTIIYDIETHRSLLDQSHFDPLGMHVNSIFNELANPDSQLII
jgi:hypothetical protein